MGVDQLSDPDLISVIGMMDTYGLWGDKASWPQLRKHNYLVTHCNREWQSLLVELFRAPQIKDRLDSLVAEIRGEPTYNLVLITILVLAIIDYPATTDILTDLCGEGTLTVGFRRNSTIRELIDFDRDEVVLKSSVTGAFLLKNVSDPEAVLKALIAITKAADKAAGASREYNAILSSLLRFGNAQNFFPQAQSSAFVLRYYESVKELRHCKRYPLFWLQYAMACLFMDDFDRAEKYFASAYSFARQTNFKTYQIDNHYARYLLRRSMNDDDPLTAMESFRQAKRLILDQMRRERLRYPYRVASLIGEWFDTYGDRLSTEYRNEVKRAAVLICSRISGLPQVLQEHRDVVDCYKKMQDIVQEDV